MKKILILLLVLLLQFSFSTRLSGGASNVVIAGPLEDNGGIPVNVQDQTTRAFSIKANVVIDNTITLATVPTVNGYTVDLTAGHGVSPGDNLAFLEQNGAAQLYFGNVLAVSGGVITLDGPVPYGFTVGGTTVFTYRNNIVDDGSLTPVVYGISNFFTEAVDITRLIFHITDATSMDDAKFGGGSALTRGVLLRKNNGDGTYINYWNVKTNGGLGELAYDKTYDEKAPAGVYGVTVRLSYAGPSKHGVAIRLEPGQSLEMLNQDDQTGLLSFGVTFQGHFTQN